MRLMLPAIRAKLLHLQALRGGALILRLTIVPVFTFVALELNDLTWHL